MARLAPSVEHGTLNLRVWGVAYVGAEVHRTSICLFPPPLSVVVWCYGSP